MVTDGMIFNDRAHDFTVYDAWGSRVLLLCTIHVHKTRGAPVS